MKMNAYINFPGSCAEAFDYYEKHLGAKVGMMVTHADAPGGRLSPEWRDKVLHARISIGGTEMMAADIPPPSTLPGSRPPTSPCARLRLSRAIPAWAAAKC
jgi:uncharacterized glyoxalase superfamily protein PhnB